MFSYNLGTAEKKVGFTSLISIRSLSSEDEKKICAPIFSNDVCLIIYKIINDFRSGIFQYSTSPLVSNDIFIKNKYKKKKLLFPKMYNNIFKYYKKNKRKHF